MSYVYEGSVNGVAGVVEYCWSSVDNCVKVVDMTIAGKFHRIGWMSKEGQQALLDLLTAHYEAQQAGMELTSFQENLICLDVK